MKPPRILLLGTGYTLGRVAGLLKPGTFYSLRSTDLDISDGRAVRSFTRNHPELRIIIDSVPPLHNSPDPLAGVKHIAEFFDRSCRIMYLSTSGVFGVEDGSWVDETTLPNPRNTWAEHRLIAENIYREAFPSVLALRIPAIYGPGRGIGHALKERRYHIVGEGLRWTNRIHVEDLARCIVALAVRGDTAALPTMLPICDDEPALAKDVVHYYCTTFNLPVPPSVTTEEARRAGSFTMTSNQRISNRLMKAIMNSPLIFPTYREGAASEFATVSK